MINENLKDDYLKNLLKTAGQEKPGADFTTRVMADVRQLQAEKAEKPLWNWVNILLALVAMLVVTILYFAVSPFLGNINILGQGIDPERMGDYLNTVLGSFQGFLALIEFLRESTITLIILFVIPALVLLDYSIKRISSRSFLFLF
jgi:fumarate reductase subunit C